MADGGDRCVEGPRASQVWPSLAADIISTGVDAKRACISLLQPPSNLWADSSTEIYPQTTTQPSVRAIILAYTIQCLSVRAEYLGSSFLLIHISPDFSLFGGADSLKEGRGASERSPRRVFSAKEGREPDVYAHTAPPQDPNDFLWLMTEEPHRTRRMAIMKAHPEARLFNPEKRFQLMAKHSRSQNSWVTSLKQNTSYYLSLLFKLHAPSFSDTTHPCRRPSF